MNEHEQRGASPAAVDPREHASGDEAGSGSGADTRDDAASGISPEERVAELERERDAHYDRLLRVTAEFDNFRKRTDRDRRDISERAAASVLEELLPIVDDFERALEADAGADRAFREGVAIIHKQLTDLLQRRGVRAIDAVGQPFDPHLHQAVTYETVPGFEEGEVVEELRRGYLLGDRLLRPSMVKVAKA